MNINLDIAAALSAVIWPVVLLIILLTYRRWIPALVEGLAKSVTKVSFGDVSVELATAKPFVPEWSISAGALDLRRSATAIQVNDSTARTFLTQLTEEGTADYAEVNLGAGQEWLTSRLYIMAIVFAKMKGIGTFVFVETSAGSRKRYVGWAEADKIRWALARRYPWLEQAYAEAYSMIISQQRGFIVSNQGRLGYQYSTQDPSPGIELLKDFLQRIQDAFGSQPIPADWVLVDPPTNTCEHANWITSDALEEILGSDLYTSTIRSSELRASNTTEQLQAFLAVPDHFVAVVTDDQRVDYLVNRSILLEQVAKSLSTATSEHK